MERCRLHDFIESVLIIAGEKVSHVYLPWKTLRCHLDCTNEIKSQQGEIGEIVCIERLVLEMSVKESKASKTGSSSPVSPHLGNLDPLRIADKYIEDVASPVDQNSDLPSYVAGQLRHIAGQLRRDDLIRIDTSLEDLLQQMTLAWLEAAKIAFRFID